MGYQDAIAEAHSVLLFEVDPSYTSQACPYCGYTSKANWLGYSYFRCRTCGFEANRDRVASLNIALRAAQPPSTSRRGWVSYPPLKLVGLQLGVVWCDLSNPSPCQTRLLTEALPSGNWPTL